MSGLLQSIPTATFPVSGQVQNSSAVLAGKRRDERFLYPEGYPDNPEGEDEVKPDQPEEYIRLWLIARVTDGVKQNRGANQVAPGDELTLGTYSQEASLWFLSLVSGQLVSELGVSFICPSVS